MVIISKATLGNFIAHHPDSEGAMEQWYAVTKEADWKNFAALKKSFNSTDAVGNDRYVFNIRGNAYRLIALIIFKVRTVYILFVGRIRNTIWSMPLPSHLKNRIMSYSIRSKKEYHQTMVDIYNLMNKGEAALTKSELRKLADMSVAAEKYEDEVLGLKPKTPTTIADAVALKLFENKMNQTQLAKSMGLAKSKVSEVLTGKRKPDLQFLKGIHKILKIDAEFLLEHA